MKEGTPLIRFDRKKILENDLDDTAVLVILDQGSIQNIQFIDEQKVQRGQAITRYE